MTFLVTGATGKPGRQVVRELLRLVRPVRELTGREPRTFEQWVRERARHFTP